MRVTHLQEGLSAPGSIFLTSGHDPRVHHLMKHNKNWGGGHTEKTKQTLPPTSVNRCTRSTVRPAMGNTAVGDSTQGSERGLTEALKPASLARSPAST